MSQENIKKYFEILELSPNASLQEIKNAYMRLEKLYSSDSIVLAPLGEEFPKRMRKKILHQIEDAYTKLLLLNKGEFQKSRLPMDVYSFKIPSPDGQTECPSFSGKFLKEVREKLGIELSDISGQLKLRIELLKSVEEENFKDLPEEAYLKSHVKSLAACLSLPPTKRPKIISSATGNGKIGYSLTFPGAILPPRFPPWRCDAVTDPVELS